MRRRKHYWEFTQEQKERARHRVTRWRWKHIDPELFAQCFPELTASHIKPPTINGFEKRLTHNFKTRGISAQQKEILDIMRMVGGVWYAPYCMNPFSPGRSWGHRMSDSWRASLSRSLRRLEKRGMIEKVNWGQFKLVKGGDYERLQG